MGIEFARRIAVLTAATSSAEFLYGYGGLDKEPVVSSWMSTIMSAARGCSYFPMGLAEVGEAMEEAQRKRARKRRPRTAPLMIRLLFSMILCP
jgi:hypothetical protein